VRPRENAILTLVSFVGLLRPGKNVAPLMDLAQVRGGTEPIRVGVVGVERIGQGVVDQVSTVQVVRLLPPFGFACSGPL